MNQPTDHDLLIELKVDVRELRSIIEKASIDNQITINDHEIRLRILEKWGSLFIGGLYVANTLLGYYLITHH